MALRKFTGVEKAEVLSKEEHEKLGSNLRKAGKTNAQQLSEAERKSLLDTER
jgi:hypothetical protein